jgi:hypothetical protein
MTASQVLPHTAARGPLSAFVDGIRDAVQRVPDVAEPEAGYQAIARLSGHLAAMWRTVYPSAAGQRGAGAQLRVVCLSRAREVEWALRWLEDREGGPGGVPDLAPGTGQQDKKPTNQEGQCR